MTEETGVVAAGGYCVPSEMVYDLISTEPGRHLPRLTLPVMSAERGGFDFTDRRTDAERAASDAMHSHVNRLVAALMKRERDVINAALVEASEHGWDVNVYRQPWHYTQRGVDPYSALRSAYIGISFTPAEYAMPVLREHLDHDWSDLDDDEMPPL